MKYFVSLIIFILPTHLKFAEKTKNYFIIWNVGQGQWTTLVNEGKCYHFDIGGEKPSVSNFPYCKSHEVYLSHLDLDHINFLKRLKKQTCVHPLPSVQNQFYKSHKYYKLQKLSKFPECQNFSLKKNSPQFVFWEANQQMSSLLKSDNDFSSVFQINHRFLIPGDSTIKAETSWIKTKNVSPFKVLVAGHHGSRTSTGPSLLEKMSALKLVVFSSRFEKYHHPHTETLLRLKLKKIPNLTTEDWGSIGFILNE